MELTTQANSTDYFTQDGITFMVAVEATLTQLGYDEDEARNLSYVSVTLFENGFPLSELEGDR